MYISQCLIVKNEEENIGYCLSHLKEIVDEQIVVDTGSTDKTVETAKEMGAKVFYFEWISDFSAARNYALSKAKGDWIIFLDADEYFTEESVPYIKPAIVECSKHKELDAVMCELINKDKNNNLISIAKNISPRIYKKNKSMKYINKIHEILINEKRPEYKFAPVVLECSKQIKIIHTGYDEEVMYKKDKSEKYINMLKKELEKNPEDSHNNLYLSISYYMNGEYENSLEYARKSLKYMDKKTEREYYPNIYSTIMYAMLSLVKPYDEIKEIFDQAAERYPEYPDYYKAIGVANLRDRNIDAAIFYFEKCINFCKNYKGNAESLALGTINETYNHLLNAYILANNKPKIVEIAVALLNAEKYDYENLIILIKTFLTSEKEENIINFLSKLYDYSTFKDKIYLTKASDAAGSDILALYYKNLLTNEELNTFQESDLI